jgi:hypothetical protein
MQKPSPIVSDRDFTRYLTPAGRLDVDGLVNEFRSNGQEHLSTSPEGTTVGAGKKLATLLIRRQGEVRTYVSY